MRGIHKILVKIVSEVCDSFINWGNVIFICSLTRSLEILFRRISFPALLDRRHSMAVITPEVVLARQSMVECILSSSLRLQFLLIWRRWFYTKRSWDRIRLDLRLDQCASQCLNFLRAAFLLSRRWLPVNAVFLSWRSACFASVGAVVAFVWTYSSVFLGGTLLGFWATFV